MTINPTKVFLVILGLALTLRLALALTYPHYWGVDFGASGETVNYWTGQVDFWNAFPKPPLAPGFLLAPFWLWIGPDAGYKIWASLFAILPLIPVYLLTSKLVSKSAALAITLFASLDWLWATMFVEGAHPMLAFALLGLCFWAVLELYQWWNWRAALTLGISLALIPWVNQTTTVLTAITLPIFWGTLFLISWHRYKKPDWSYGPKLVNLLQVLPVAFMGALIGALALPWYMQTLPGSDGLTYGGPTLFWSWGLNTLQLAIALPLAGWVIWKSERAELKALAAILLALSIMAQFLSYDEVIINPLYRARYFMGMAAYPLLAWVAWTYWKSKIKAQWISWAAGTTTAIYMLGAFIFVTYSTASYATMVTKESAEAMKLTGDENVGTNAFSLSLAVTALNKVHSPALFTAPPPPAHRESDADLRCVMGWVEGCEPGQAAHRLGIRYILVDERFPHYGGRVVEGNYGAPENQWEVTRQAPWLRLMFSESSTKLWEIQIKGESNDATIVRDQS